MTDKKHNGTNLKLIPEVYFTIKDQTMPMVGKVKVIKAIEDEFDCSIGEVLEQCMKMKKILAKAV